jgi:hypothetical protein
VEKIRPSGLSHNVTVLDGSKAASPPATRFEASEWRPQPNPLWPKEGLDIRLGPYGGIKPTDTYFSGDATNDVSDITWSSWTQTGATGQGTWTYLSCIPDCADSPGLFYPATITLSDPVNGVFTSLIETAQGPYGFTNVDTYSGGSWPGGASGGQPS